MLNKLLLPFTLTLCAIYVVYAATATSITDIQGTSFLSPFAGKTVSDVTGVVTAIGDEGFYISGTPSTDVRVSNGLFIFSESSDVLGKVSVGDMVSVTGSVSEFVSTDDPDESDIR